MYFAPGYNQPYTCIGAESSKGVTFTFNTTYNNKNQTRLNTNDFRNSFRSEMSYTDNDYVLHLFFAWDAFYNKLPENGSDWRFEVLAFAPNGGYTWGGSRGIHSASQWGNLRFSLSEKQIAEIRKEILFRASRFYQDFKTEPNVTENIFTILRDPYVGDPDFYRECVIPLEQELASYAKIVQEKKSNLSDEEVNEIYGKAVPKMKGLQYEIDELRRKYLMKQLMQGKSLPK